MAHHWTHTQWLVPLIPYEPEQTIVNLIHLVVKFYVIKCYQERAIVSFILSIKSSFADPVCSISQFFFYFFSLKLRSEKVK